MSLNNAIKEAGVIPGPSAVQSLKKAYSERLSRALATEIADGMRHVGFAGAKPLRGQPGEKEFYGGLGGKRVDVSYSDERHGLIQAVSVKSICFQPFGKNLKNRFGDLCTEAITLHMRFPYATVCMFFAFPMEADNDKTPRRRHSTFQRAMRMLATVSGRSGYTDAGEKFENITLLLFKPLRSNGEHPSFKLFDAITRKQLTENQYFKQLLELHDSRNPHCPLAEDVADED